MIENDLKITWHDTFNKVAWNQPIYSFKERKITQINNKGTFSTELYPNNIFVNNIQAFEKWNNLALKTLTWIVIENLKLNLDNVITMDAILSSPDLYWFNWYIWFNYWVLANVNDVKELKSEITIENITKYWWEEWWKIEVSNNLYKNLIENQRAISIKWMFIINWISSILLKNYLNNAKNQEK